MCAFEFSSRVADKTRLSATEIKMIGDELTRPIFNRLEIIRASGSYPSRERGLFLFILSFLFAFARRAIVKSRAGEREGENARGEERERETANDRYRSRQIDGRKADSR